MYSREELLTVSLAILTGPKLLTPAKAIIDGKLFLDELDKVAPSKVGKEEGRGSKSGGKQ